MTHEHEIVRGACRCGVVALVCGICQRECIGGWLRGDDRLVCLSCITDALGAADQYVEDQLLASQAALRRVHDTWHRQPAHGCLWCSAAALERILRDGWPA